MLRAETLKLIQRMEEEEDTDDLFHEINALTKMVKRHNEAIRGLEEGSLQVEVEVERERCSVGLVVEAAENVVWRERRCVANREEARHLYFAGGAQAGVGCVASVYCWKEGEEEGKGWEAVSRLGQARALHAMAVLGGQVYVLGGDIGKNRLSSVERYDVKEDRWEAVAAMSTARGGCAAAVLGGRLYVMGGDDNEDNVLSSVERYDAEEDRWEAVADMALPFDMSYLQAVSL